MLKLEHGTLEKNRAEILTKALGRVKFPDLRANIKSTDVRKHLQA